MGRCIDRRMIGEVLIERGIVTPEQLRQGLAVQRKAPTLFIGEVLIQLGFVSEIEIVTALVLQCNLPYISISRYQIDPEIINLIPADMACRDGLIPLDRIGNILSLVMQNPLNDTTRESVERLTGCKIAVFISTRSEIQAALLKFYGKGII